MTSSSILPSIGPAPPQFRRPQVPENLRPKLSGEGADEKNQQNLTARSRSADQSKAAADKSGETQSRASQSSGPEISAPRRERPLSASVQISPGANLGGASAVAIQIQEAKSSRGLDAASDKKPQDLTEEEKTTVKRLKERDREVRAHENAHASVGRGYTGAPSYEFTRGPDGVQYAVGGHVDIDVSEIPDNPRGTITKMEVVRSAALAPARPSGQDRAVAAAASAKAREAHAELAAERKEELEQGLSKDGSSQDRPLSVNQSGESLVDGSAHSFESHDQLGLGGVATSRSQQPEISLNLLV